MNYVKDLFKQVPGRLLVNIIWFLLTSIASALAVLVTSLVYSSGFKPQYLITAIPVFLLTTIISWLIFRRRPIESYTFGNTCQEYVINLDGTATHSTHLEICPNMHVCDKPVIKGKFEDLPGWSDPVLNHDGSLMGSTVDKNYFCRYFIWLIDLPVPRQLYTCVINREFTGPSKPMPYISWQVNRKRQSMTFFVAIHKNHLFDKDNVMFVTSSLKGQNVVDRLLIVEDDSDYGKSNNNDAVQVNSANYYIFSKTVKNPPIGYKYSIEWKWDV